jgi:hypothetical protein
MPATGMRFGGSRRARRLLLAALVLATVGLVVAPPVLADEPHHGAGTGDTEGAVATGSRVGVLVADHGEPPEYNEWTYESFREFFQHLIDMGLIPTWITALEAGTILYDADCPACDEASASPRLIDAWLRPHDGPATFVPASESLPAHYVQPAGPGFREPDIFEHVGLGAWHEWQRMGGRSPNYDEKLPRKQTLIERLRADYGDRLAIRVGYMIDPRFGGSRFGIREALDSLVNRDRVESLVVVYHGVGFSDIMQTHHLRHMVREHLETLAVDIPVRFAAPPGTSDRYVRAVVEKVQAELAKVPADASVAVHLSGHGLPTGMCGEYDCGADAYHRFSADLFARVRTVLEAAIDRPGRTGIFHLYGDGGEGDDDPDDEVDGPIEALDARAAAGYGRVIDIPFEFDANSRDTLIVLRQGYRREAPDWNAAWESRFAYKNMSVTIANVNGGDEHKAAALQEVTAAALAGWIEPSGASAAQAGHEHSGAAAVTGSAHRTHGGSAVPAGFDGHGAGAPHDHAAAPSTSALGDDDHGHGTETAAAASHDHAGTAHGHGHDAASGWPTAAGVAALAMAAVLVWRARASIPRRR